MTDQNTSIDEFTDEEYVAYLRNVAADLDAAGTPTLAEDYREAARRIERPVIPATTIIVTGPGDTITTGKTLKQAFDAAAAASDPEDLKTTPFYGRVIYADSRYPAIDLGQL